MLLIIGLLLYLCTPRSCNSFSFAAVVTRTAGNNNSARRPSRRRPGIGIDNEGAGADGNRRENDDANGDDDDDDDPNAASWRNQERYIEFHQTVGKRKTIRRLLEIFSVLSGNILRPLVCSLFREPPRFFPLRLQPNIGTVMNSSSSSSSSTNENTWDEFWRRKTKSLSNAERVAKGLPPLGPTFVKLGQALATRPDVLQVPLAEALANLQDRVAPFDNFTAKRIIRRDMKMLLLQRREKEDEQSEEGGALRLGLGARRQRGQRSCCHIQNDADLETFLNSLSNEPVASASVAQVYKGTLPGYGPVAVKVQRPGVRRTAEKDATLLHTVATWLERQRWPNWSPLASARGEPMFGKVQLVKAVDEFTARVLEDLDFEREASNMNLFAEMYCHRRGSSPDVQVVVPELIPDLCSRRVLVMEWLHGQKLTDICRGCDDPQAEVEENLALVRKAIEMTLSQLLTTGIVHADPHSGNLLKVRTSTSSSSDGRKNKAQKSVELGYLDFGLVNEVPQRFQDGIVCATCQLVFARNIHAVADLCIDLGLLPQDKLNDAEERERFTLALERALDDVLIWPKDERGRSTAVPKIRFENALSSIRSLISNFEFTIPPYFLNNARALATLEGIALKLDPEFNILRVIYPYSINHLMRNPSVSHKAQETFLEICKNPDTKLFDHHRFMLLLNDWSLLTGYKKRRIYWDLITSVGTRQVLRRIVTESCRKQVRRVRGWFDRYILAYWEQSWLMAEAYSAL